MDKDGKNYRGGWVVLTVDRRIHYFTGKKTEARARSVYELYGDDAIALINDIGELVLVRVPSDEDGE